MGEVGWWRGEELRGIQGGEEVIGFTQGYVAMT